jgi:hypothetical protein
LSNDGWRQYGKYNKNEQFDFYPSLFINAIGEQLKLQEMLCYSQLFVEYVNRKERDSMETAELSKSDVDVGRFIATFVYFHWRRRKRIKSKVVV